MARRCELTGKGVLTGNNVSHAHNKTRRRFMPNVQEMALHSEILGRAVRFKVCVSALRTIEKKGGLDAYLSDAKDRKLSLKARRLKRAVTKAAAQAAAGRLHGGALPTAAAAVLTAAAAAGSAAQRHARSSINANP